MQQLKRVDENVKNEIFPQMESKIESTFEQLIKAGALRKDNSQEEHASPNKQGGASQISEKQVKKIIVK